MKIVLAGGGTGGSVSPLLAVKDEILKLQPKTEFVFFGAAKGPEKPLIEASGLPFYSVPAGKFRRYFSLFNLLTPFLMVAGFCKAFFLIRKIKPRAIFSAGSFVSVPVAYAGFLLRCRIIIHQQDVAPSLSNKLIMPIADNITVSLDISEKDFYSGSGLFRLPRRKRNKVILTGNPIRREILMGSRETAIKIFGLENDLPVLLVLGGSSGSLRINRILEKVIPEMTRYFQILHITGKNRLTAPITLPRYHRFEFLTSEMPHALAAADIVICRAGMQTLSEIAALRKTSIVVPLPDSHQVFNAFYFYRRKAIIYAPERILTSEGLIENLRKLLFDSELQKILKRNLAEIMPKDAANRVAQIIIQNN